MRYYVKDASWKLLWIGRSIIWPWGYSMFFIIKIPYYRMHHLVKTIKFDITNLKT